MTSFELICAVLSAAAYREKRDQNNLTPFPVGATRTSYTLDPSSGFEASAFEYDDKIVISYAGTRISEDDGFIAAAKDSFPDGYTDLMLGFFGHGEEQLRKAAEFYARVKQAYPGRENDIVFTGHSLGGGLAAVMGVYFDKPAITFDPAPFRLAATRGNALVIADYLLGKGFADDANFLRSYYTPTETTLALGNPGIIPFLLGLPSLPGFITAIMLGSMAYPTQIPGEQNIRAIATEGEFLTAGYPSVGLGPSQLDSLRIRSGFVEILQHGRAASGETDDRASMPLILGVIGRRGGMDDGCLNGRFDPALGFWTSVHFCSFQGAS